MAEYIEREAALKELNRNSITKKLTLANGVSIFDTIKNIPAADVVEVVRCKDCKKWDMTRRFGISCACSHWSPSIKDCRFTLPDGFCSEGIRKEGAENG